MAKVTVSKKIKIGSRTFPVKKVKPFSNIVADAVVESTSIQIRAMAYAAKDLIIDRLLAQEPEIGRKIVRREADVRHVNKLYIPPDVPLQQEREEDDKKMDRYGYIEIPKRESPRPSKGRSPLELEPLTKDYLEKKVRAGKDPRILISNAEYLRGIVVRKRKDAVNGVYYIVTVANRKHPEADITLRKLAAILEYGTREYNVPLFGDENKLVKISIPPRPHWKPAIREIIFTRKKLAENIEARALKKILSEIQ